MTDTARAVAANPDAPADERFDATAERQREFLPSSVPDMLPLVQYVAEQYADQQMMEKALTRAKVIPFPSRAAEQRKGGMQSVFLDDRRINIQGEWFDRQSNFSFDAMRNMVFQTPVLASVIKTRQRQVKRFCRVSENGKGPGFQIKLKDPNGKVGKAQQDEMLALSGFFTNCGWENNPRRRMRLRRDNFSNFMAKLVEDSLIMDSAAIETEYKRNRELGMDGMYAVDGATIRLCSEQGYQGDDELFALQVIDGQIRAAYTYDDLIYVPRNPSTSVLAGGYGQSETELLIRTVTGFLNAFTYNTRYFDSNSIPKGLLHLHGDYSTEDLSAFKRIWNGMVRGINNAWSLPVMVSKNKESAASFESFNNDVSDVLFAKWMTFLTAIICAVYGMSPDEINIESFTTGASTLSGNDTEEKLISSKDKGLRPLLAHFEDLFSDYVVSDFGDQYVFRWTGLDDEDPKTAWEKFVSTATVNEARKAQGQDPVKDSWGDAPLNPVLVPVWQQENQANSEDFGDPDEDDPAGGEFGGGDADGKPDGGDDQADQQQDDAAEPADDGLDLAKSFGLPVFRIEV